MAYKKYNYDFWLNFYLKFVFSFIFGHKRDTIRFRKIFKISTVIFHRRQNLFFHFYFFFFILFWEITQKLGDDSRGPLQQKPWSLFLVGLTWDPIWRSFLATLFALIWFLKQKEGCKTINRDIVMCIFLKIQAIPYYYIRHH